MVRNNTVSQTVNSNLCVSCGACKGICPQKCISWERSRGMFNPVIDEDQCISCGLCLKVCPGIQQEYENVRGIKDESVLIGPYMKVCNANSKSSILRHISASGGIVSTLINHLLTEGTYDAAFCVSTYNYEKQVGSELITGEKLNLATEEDTMPKSRYVAVSHESAISFITNNPDKKVVLIGTSCAVRALEMIIRIKKLNRDNYLIIGLFCDKIFNYNIFEYFSNHKACGNRKLELLHFKNKDSGGWPGNMKFIYSDGSHSFVNENERMKMKAYFMPERCLYCLDKLNVNADISVGDNFTNVASSKLGSNSVIIRTHRGLKSWKIISTEVDEYECDIEVIMSAQNLKARYGNGVFAKQKELLVKEKKGQEICLNKGLDFEIIPENARDQWQEALNKIEMGAIYKENPNILIKHITKIEFKKKVNAIRLFPKELLHKTKILIFGYKEIE